MRNGRSRPKAAPHPASSTEAPLSRSGSVARSKIILAGEGERLIFRFAALSSWSSSQGGRPGRDSNPDLDLAEDPLYPFELPGRLGTDPSRGV